jgi:hypothetical protein
MGANVLAHARQRYRRIRQMNTLTLLSTYKLYMLSASLMWVYRRLFSYETGSCSG